MPYLGGKLSQKQEKFVDFYAISGNSTDAARQAGYSAKTARVIGQENLLKPAIKEALEARQQAFRAELKITKDDVVSGLLGAIQLGRQQQNPAVMISGLVQIAKMLGFYEPERVSVQLSAAGSHLKAKYEALTDEQLLAIIAGDLSSAQMMVGDSRQ
jgi:phage terminase small subunit